ncbi:MAG: hypothetical protein R3B06_07800 [Kofleriaceae bacterium]
MAALLRDDWHDSLAREGLAPASSDASACPACGATDELTADGECPGCGLVLG